MLACLAAAVCAPPALAKKPALEKSLAAAAPRANPKVIRLAVEAAACADHFDRTRTRRLAVIDYSKPSTQARLWVFDLTRRKLMFEELVAHGRNSGQKYARVFSNEVDSLTSSLGLFRTQQTYRGVHGYSLRMAGLEAGVNDRAEERAIVMHSAPYVSRTFVRQWGRLGLSHGCPVVRTEIAKRLIDTLKEGQYIFAYYPDRQWLDSSRYFSCPARTAPKKNKLQSADSLVRTAAPS